jgi:hypothetical protein
MRRDDKQGTYSNRSVRRGEGVRDGGRMTGEKEKEHLHPETF